MKTDPFKDQSLQVEVDRHTAGEREKDTRRSPVGSAGPTNSTSHVPAVTFIVSTSARPILHWRVKPLIQERMNTYIELKPVRFVNNGNEIIGGRNAMAGAITISTPPTEP